MIEYFLVTRKQRFKRSVLLPDESKISEKVLDKRETV